MNHSIRRYSQLWLASTTVAMAALISTPSPAAQTAQPAKLKEVKKLKAARNQDFYQDGKFQVEKAKQAYFDLMAVHGYPVPESLRTNMWVTDFGLGDFARVGMAGVFWVNFQDTGYFAHEIYLLPGQMIVEHGHDATAKGKAKMESWHVRHGRIYTFGEEGNPIPANVSLPASQQKFMTATKCYEMLPGDIRTLNRVGAKHFMMGGAAGAIVTEYGSFHDNDGLRFTNPGVKF